MIGNRRPPADDAGITLIEMMVSFGIFSVLMIIFTTGVIGANATLRRTESIAATQSQSGLAFSRLDADLRYASAIVKDSATSAYYVLPPRSGGAPDCFRLQLVGDRLQRTALTLPASATRPPAQTIASGVRATTAGAFTYLTSQPQVFTITLVSIADADAGHPEATLVHSFQLPNLGNASGSRLPACQSALS